MYASSVSVVIPVLLWAWLAGVKVVSVCLLCTVGSRDQLEVHGVCLLMDGRYLLCLVVSKLPPVCSQLQLF